MLPIIAEAGADGVEIRRELLTDAELKTLSTMASAIELFGLLACYSAPEPLFLDDGNLNPRLPQLLEEAQALQALWLKVSLGHFSHTEQFDDLREWLDNSGMELVVENDQTACGRLQPMQRFNEACQTQSLPISLTFDMGNWLWVGDSRNRPRRTWRQPSDISMSKPQLRIAIATVPYRLMKQIHAGWRC